jgi:hypothetical protein
MKLTRAPRLSTVMVSSTIIPSREAAGQQALVWLENQVALAEHHQLAVEDADGLDDVHVLADDRGDVG